MLAAVVTTIQQPTNCVLELARALCAVEGRLVVVGDAKGPAVFPLPATADRDVALLNFLDLESQLDSGFALARELPTGHYCRKNIGYLQAIADGATCIYETDDDNRPLDTWRPRSEYLGDIKVLTAQSARAPQWVNVYRYFTRENIWPRGLPLDEIHGGFECAPLANAAGLRDVSDRRGVWAPVQQGLADGSPDVDAIWRLVLDRDFYFDAAGSVIVPPGHWCPFNSQSTWWWPVVYPLMYIPSYCSFRMCDIWRSFIAQRCLWELGAGVAFHAPEVFQERNPHNLMRDFEDEVPGYRGNQRIAALLEDTPLQSGPNEVAANLYSCFETLVHNGIFPGEELLLVETWISDLQRMRAPSR